MQVSIEKNLACSSHVQAIQDMYLDILADREECPSKKLRINILKYDQQNLRQDAKKIMPHLFNCQLVKDMIINHFRFRS